MYQQLTIVGNVGRDPELRYTQGGVAVCDFSVATNERWTDKDTNEQREKTTWFKVSCWRGLAETCNEYLTKGRQVMVVGTVDASAWTGNDGEPRATLELTARTVQFLGSRDDSEGPPPRDDEDLQDIPF